MFLTNTDCQIIAVVHSRGFIPGGAWWLPSLFVTASAIAAAQCGIVELGVPSWVVILSYATTVWDAISLTVTRERVAKGNVGHTADLQPSTNQCHWDWFLSNTVRVGWDACILSGIMILSSYTAHVHAYICAYACRCIHRGVLGPLTNLLGISVGISRVYPSP